MSFSNTYKIQSAGAAYTLPVGFKPTRIEAVNATKWATDATKVEFKWFEGMAAAAALSELCEDDGLNRAIEAANGFTVLESVAFPDAQATVTGITAAYPAVVTAASHGWTAANNGDMMRITGVLGMVEINNLIGKFTYINANSFSIDIDATNFSAYGSLGTAFNLSEDVVPAGSYRVTLGSTIMGADNDIIFVTCYNDDVAVNKGDVA